MYQDTKCIEGGYTPKNGESRMIPIVQSTTFKYDTSADMGKLFDLEASGYFYSRLQNPTNDYVAAKIAELEGGTAAMLTSSGQAANFFAIFNIATAGDHVVASASIYGGTYNLFKVTMAKMGIEFTFVEPDCTDEELDAAFQENTKAVFGETIANPALTVFDFERFANAAHAHGVPLIVDNTFATPINCRPFQWGADIVTHSTTKYMDGHDATVGGCIVDSGKFDWMANADKFPGLCTPDESYHGIVYAEKFGKEGAYITKATSQLMRDFGAIQAPMNAYLINLGLESLAVRMARHCENGQAVAEFLEQHPEFDLVSCQMQMFDSEGVYRVNHPKEFPTKKDLVYGPMFCHAGCMIRTDVLRAVGGYNISKEVERIEDYDLWFRLYKNGFCGANIIEPLYSMRDDRREVKRSKMRHRNSLVYCLLLRIE